MECTQRLECTQELYDTHTERVCLEQIGFLGICGAKHPVLRGPNKIGRDPQTCSIVLNLNSVSRQHAVINVLNSKEFMLMDLDSANKTKLLNKTLRPYIPHPMKDGDTIQFGDIFGIFRLLEENDELPMTQAIDIPETPAQNRYVSKLNKVPTTVIPESPDVSDRDDSFLTTHDKRTRVSGGQFIKSFGRTLSIQPIRSPKTDISSISSKRSSSINNLDTSVNESFKSHKDEKIIDNIHEMNTQIPYTHINPTFNESTDSIYTADTQIPPGQGISPSIHKLSTQIPSTEHLPQVRTIDGQQELQFDIYAANKENDLSIYNAETQPFVCGKDELMDNENILIETKESGKTVNDLNKSDEELLFNEIDDGCLEDFNSQPLLPQESPKAELNLTAPTKVSINESDNSKDCDEIDIIPTQKAEELVKKYPQAKIVEEVKSKALKRTNRMKSDSSTDCEDIDIIPTQKVEEFRIKNTSEKLQQEIKSTDSHNINSNVLKICEDIDLIPTQIVEEFNVQIPINSDKRSQPLASKRISRIKSDSSTDCEDIESTTRPKILKLQKASAIAAKRINRIQSDSSTDCDDIALMPTQKVLEKRSSVNQDVADCQDDLTDISLKRPPLEVIDTKFEDMPTQVLDLDTDKLKPGFAEMDTQIVYVDENTYKKSTNDDSYEDQPTQIVDEILPNNNDNILNEIISPFKIPLQSPLRVKSKDIPKIIPKDRNSVNKSDIDNINYYNATQDILDDLCTQRDGSPILNAASEKPKNSSPIIIDDEIVPCSIEGYKVGEKFANIERQLSPTKNKYCEEGNAKKFAAGLSSQEVRNGIGVELLVDNLKKTPSESASDVECTPKKVRSFLFTDSDLPNSQEIQNNIFIKPNNSYAPESSSESEPEVNTEEQSTPIVHRKKKPRTVARIDLTKRFDAEKLPERIITRVRKPTLKMQENFVTDKKISTNILKPKFITEQEDQIDEDIIKENVKRLRTYGKAKSNENTNDVKNGGSKSDTKCKDNKTDTTSKDVKNNMATESKSKEKIKVKIEKPKKKDIEKDKKAKSQEESSRKEEQQSRTLKKNEKSQDRKAKGDTDRNSINNKTESEVVISTRSTRSKRKNNDIKTVEKKSVAEENNKKTAIDSSKKGKPISKKEPPKESTSPELEIRRSRRNTKPKDNTSDNQDCQVIQEPKSILKKNIHEQSTVYNVSSSSGESLKNLKRSLADDSELPSPKRTRAFVNNVNSSVTSVSLRATPARTMKTQYVLFTAFPSEEVKNKLEKLGAVVVTNIMECSVVLTMQVKRTFKLLCAVGLGRPIVGPDWVQACVDTRMIVDPWLYLVKDESAEKRFHFNLERTLNGKRNFLNGYNVSSTPSVQPNASEMKLIVECSGGVWKEGGPNWICVSSTKDQALWPSLRKRGATVVTTEFILGGVLRQKIEINANKFP